MNKIVVNANSVVKTENGSVRECSANVFCYTEYCESCYWFDRTAYGYGGYCKHDNKPVRPGTEECYYFSRR